MPKRLVHRNRLLRVVVVTLVAILTAGTVSATVSSSTTTATTSSSPSDSQLVSPSFTIKANQKIISMVESRLLNMFGLKTKPKPSPNSQIPEYMLQLFRKQQKLNKDNVMLASTIRSFSHQDHFKLDDQHPIDQFRFMFNVTRTSSEVLQAAELRLYRHSLPAQNRDKTRTKTTLTKSRKNLQRILVYDVLHPSTDSSEAILRLIDSRQVDAGSRAGWESFDVLPAVTRWDRDPKTNHGLHVRVIASDSNASNAVVEPHVRLRRSTTTDERTWHKQKPLLVTYSDDANAARASTSSKVNNNADRRRRSKNGKGERKKNSKEHRVENCRRHSLYVDFGDVGWNDWIVAPVGYNAFYCDGECKFPLPDHLNTTNHAIVQTLVHSVNPSSVPRVCCVPTELSPISMLYLDEYDKVVLKNYQDMVVEGCGCR